MATTLNMTLLLRRDDFTAEAKKSYVLLAGEPGYCTTTKTFKVGDGSTTWENLGFANQSQIEALIAIVDQKITDLGNVATDEEVEAIRSALQAAIDLKVAKADYEADKATFALKNDVATELAKYTTTEAQEVIDAEQDRRLGLIETELDTHGDIVTHNVAEFATAEQGAKADAAAVKADVDEALAARYTKTEADGLLAAKADKSVVDAMYTNTQIDELVQGAKDYADENDTKYGIVYDSDNKKIKLVEGGSEVEIDASAFIKDGMISEVTIGDDNDLVITFNTDAGKENIVLPLDQLVDIYTGVEGARVKVTVNSDKSISADLVAGSISKNYFDEGVQASLAKADSALQSADLADYAKSEDVTDEIAEAIAGEVTRAEGAYSKLDHKHVVADITDYAADVASKIEAYGYATDENAQKYATDAQAAAEGTAAGALATARTEITAEISAAVNPVEARVKAIEDAPYATEAFVTAAVAGKDVGVTKVTAGTDIVVTPEAGTGDVTVAHKEYSTGTVKAADGTEEPNFVTSITINNGHVTGATVQTLKAALESMEFILDCGSAE